MCHLIMAIFFSSISCNINQHKLAKKVNEEEKRSLTEKKKRSIRSKYFLLFSLLLSLCVCVNVYLQNIEFSFVIIVW